MDTSAAPHATHQTGVTPDPAVDPDGDPAMMPTPVDTSGTPPVRGPQDTASAADDPEDRDDPDADPEMLGSGR